MKIIRWRRAACWSALLWDIGQGWSNPCKRTKSGTSNKLTTILTNLHNASIVQKRYYYRLWWGEWWIICERFCTSEWFFLHVWQNNSLSQCSVVGLKKTVNSDLEKFCPISLLRDTKSAKTVWPFLQEHHCIWPI